MSLNALCAEYVLPIDAKMTVYHPGVVIVQDKKILEVGQKNEILNKYPGISIEDFGDKVIMPGFINLHCHFPMIFTRGLGDDLELMTWLNKYVFPLEAQLLSADYVYDASLAGCAELIHHGFTSVLDMYYYTACRIHACEKIGIRAWLNQAIIGFPTTEYESTDKSIEETRDLIIQWKNHSRLQVTLGPHSAYTLSPEHLKKCKQIADETDSILHVHLAESDSELQSVFEQHKKHPVDLLNEIGFLGRNVVAAHCVKLNEAQIGILAEKQTSVAHNPCSNLKLTSGIAPVVEMQKQGICVGLGTDGPMSSNRMDPFHVMDLVAKVQKTLKNDPVVMPASEVIRMGTINGAKALNVEDKIGSLEPGKIADLIVIDHKMGMFSKVHDIYVHLVYACHGEMVQHVMIDGQWVLRDHCLQKIDDADISELSDKWEPKIQNIVQSIVEDNQ